MSGGIELQPNNLILNLIQNSESTAEREVLSAESSAQISGGENGAVFLNLDWRNRQAENLRQALTRILSDASTESNPTNPVWRDLITLAKEHEDFAGFRRQPENFWQQVRQMSETRIAGDDDSSKAQTASRFDKLLSEMQSRKMPLREFVQTLPPNERQVFQAAYQLKQFFGTNIFSADGAALSEAKQTRLSEASSDTQYAANLREGKLAFSGSTPVATDTALLGGSVAGYQNFSGAPTGNTALQNTAAASRTALGVNATAPDSVAAHGAVNNAAENKTQTGAVVQRENGTIISGALISRALAAIGSDEKPEKIKSDNSQTDREVFAEAGAFVSGAFGTMFGATLGKVVPRSETVVSGLLGFVSSVVVGADVDQGLRWLSESVNFVAPTDNGVNVNSEKQATNDKLLTTGAALQPVWA